MRSEKEKRFIETLNKHQGIVHKVCRMFTHNQDAHNELFQEVMLHLWQSFESFRGEAKISTWIYRVAINTAISLYKADKKRGYAVEFDDKLTNVSEDDDEEKKERSKSLYKAIEKLSHIEKALVLLYLENKDYKEISYTLGISEVNARVKMSRTKKKLKELMSG